MHFEVLSYLHDERNTMANLCQIQMEVLILLLRQMLSQESQNEAPRRSQQLWRTKCTEEAFLTDGTTELLFLEEQMEPSEEDRRVERENKVRLWKVAWSPTQAKRKHML